MKTKDNLAEALRQIEPIVEKKRSKSRDSGINSKIIDNDDKEKEELQKDEVIEEIKASFEENMKVISDLSQEERVTFRQKRQNFNQRQQER